MLTPFAALSGQPLGARTRGMENHLECRCQGHYGDLGERLLDTFAAVREHCPALKRILIPDEVWSAFQEWNREPLDDAHHRSILLLAMDRGSLYRITSVIHRYLIEAGAPRPNLRQQYLQDLQEHWMACKDPLERHRKARAFLGRLIELQCAGWLESRGWTIEGLEAFREGPDIEARIDSGVVTAFEVKFIGSEDEDFLLVLNSLRGRSAARSSSPYAAANYLLFRAYEAAKQLKRTALRRIAVLVVHEQTWYRFDLQLKQDWIDWCNPAFFQGDPQWEEFLKERRERYPQLEGEMRQALRDLDAIWILRLSDPWEYARVFEIDMRAWV